MPYEQTGTPELVIVGEAPGIEELEQGKQFVGKSGKLLRGKLPTQKVHFLNTCQCGNSKPKIADVRFCNVRQEIQTYLHCGIPVVLAGEYALKAWFDRGDINVTDNRGYIQDFLYATYHPASCLRDSKYTRWMEEDLDHAYSRYKPNVITISANSIGRLADFPTTIGQNIVFDIETTGLVRERDTFTVGCIYLPWCKKLFQIEDPQLLREIFKQRIKACTIIGHGIKFDLIFPCIEVDLQPMSGRNPIEDTLVMARIAYSGLPAYGLSRLAEDFLGYQKWWVYDGRVDKFRDQAENCGRDVIATWGLYNHLKPHIKQYEKPYEISLNATAAFSSIEREGIPIESKELDTLIREHRAKIDRAEAGIFNQIQCDGKTFSITSQITTKLNKEQIKKLTGIGIGSYMNINSDQQCMILLYDVYGIPLRTKTYNLAKRSVDDYSLATLEKTYPIARALRAHSKVVTDYGLLESLKGKYLSSGKIYPQHKPEGAATGRPSCALPNIQQNKKQHLRRIIHVGPDEVLLEIDWSQIELRVLAYITQDPVMIQAYLDGIDQHTATMNYVRSLGSNATRYDCKPVNFSLVYGVSEYGLQREMFLQGVDKPIEFWRDLLEAKKTQWPGVAKWMFDAHTNVTEAISPIGRRRVLTEGAERAYRQKLNHPVQSFANDISLAALYWFWRELRPEWGRIIAYIHDAILCIIRKEYLIETYELYQKVFSNQIITKCFPDLMEGFKIPIYGDFKVLKRGK